MFEAEIEQTKLRLVEELLSSTGRPSLPIATVLDHPTLDQAYKQFFQAEVEWLLYQDRISRRTGLPIDPEEAEFHQVYSQFQNYVRKHARFSRTHAIALIDTAVKSILNFRLRPRVTLKWFVFRGEPTKPICEIVLRMRYFADYPYFLNSFYTWINERQLNTESHHIMPVFEFERLIKQIDDDFILDLSTTEFIELLDPIFSFFNSCGTPSVLQAVPIEAIVVFLDDKDIQVIAQKLERMLYHDGVRTITRDTILRVVDTVLEELEQQETVPQSESISFDDTQTLQKNIPEAAVQYHIIEADAQSVSAELSAAPEGDTLDVIPVEKTVPYVGKIDSTPDIIEHPEQSAGDDRESLLNDVLSFQSENREDMGSEEDQPPQTASENHNTEIEESPLVQEIPPEHAGAPAVDIEACSESSLYSGKHQSYHPELTEDDVQFLTTMLTEVAEGVAAPQTTSSERMQDVLISDLEVDTEPMQQDTAPKIEQADTSSEQVVQVTAPSELMSPSLRDMFDSGVQHVYVSQPQHALLSGSILSFLDESLRNVIVTKLCNYDQSRFDALVVQIDRATTLKAALNQLDHYIVEYGIDPTEKAVKELRIAIIKRYALTE